MQPIRRLSQWLSQNADEKHYLFTLRSLKPLFPEMAEATFKTLLSRAVKSELLVRVCRGIYLYSKAMQPDGLLLFHVAALLRSHQFNYISLETMLSDAGVISQIPMSWISIMSSGRTSVVTCGSFGTIEFVHTAQKPAELTKQLVYDQNCGLWRANVALALRDMRVTRRNCDLINWNIANEFI